MPASQLDVLLTVVAVLDRLNIAYRLPSWASRIFSSWRWPNADADQSSCIVSALRANAWQPLPGSKSSIAVRHRRLPCSPTGLRG